MLDNGGIMIQFLSRIEDFPLLQTSRLSLRVTQPPIQWVREALSYGIEQPQHEIHNSSASDTEVNNALSYTFTPPHDFMTWCLIKLMKTDASFYIYISQGFSLLGCDVASLDKSFLMFNMEHEALTMTATCSLEHII